MRVPTFAGQDAISYVGPSTQAGTLQSIAWLLKKRQIKLKIRLRKNLSSHQKVLRWQTKLSMWNWNATAALAWLNLLQLSTKRSSCYLPQAHKNKKLQGSSSVGAKITPCQTLVQTRIYVSNFSWYGLLWSWLTSGTQNTKNYKGKSPDRLFALVLALVKVLCASRIIGARRSISDCVPRSSKSPNIGKPKTRVDSLLFGGWGQSTGYWSYGYQSRWYQKQRLWLSATAIKSPSGLVGIFDIPLSTPFPPSR